MLVEMYQRWLFEVWGKGDYAAATSLLHQDLVDHNSVPGQPSGRDGDLWAAVCSSYCLSRSPIHARCRVRTRRSRHRAMDHDGHAHRPTRAAWLAAYRPARHDERSGDLSRSRRPVRRGLASRRRRLADAQSADGTAESDTSNGRPAERSTVPTRPLTSAVMDPRR